MDGQGSTKPERGLEELVFAYLEAIEAGREAEAEALLAQHPGLADAVREYRAFEAGVDRLFGPPDAEQEPLLPPGTLINDYRIMKFLAHGGMGVVYQAWQLSLKREVALKMLRARALGSPEANRRLREEAAHAAQLAHPNIVPIHEVGEHQGLPYFSMELIRGSSLAELPPGLADDPRQGARLLAAVARAVHHAHERGLLHRDLKPANVLLAGAREQEPETQGKKKARRPSTPSVALVPMVTDFGLAQPIGTAPEGRAGTPSYMAPEQTEGTTQLTVRVDVYGLGAILYELLTGRPPFPQRAPACEPPQKTEGTTQLTVRVDVYDQIRTLPPVPPRDFWPRVPRDLEAICLKCLEKKPARRYDSAAAVADDLQRFLEKRPVQARPRSLAGALGLWVWRQPTLAALLAVLLVVVGLALHSWWQQQDRRRQQALNTRALYISTIHQADRALAAGQLTTASAFLDSCPAELHGWEYHYLRRACARQVVTVRHDGQVLRVEYSPNGFHLATAGEEGQVKLWDPVTGQLLHTLPGTSACFCSDSCSLLTAGEHQPVQQWDIETGQLRKTFRQRGRRVVAARDQPMVACIDSDQVLSVWRLDQEQPVRKLELGGQGQGRLLIVSAIGQAGGLQNLWQVGWTAQTMSKARSGNVIDFALSPDGRYLAVGGFHRLLKVWDTTSGKEIRMFALPEWADWRDVWAITFSSDSHWLVAGGNRPIVWEVDSGKPLPPYSGTGDLNCNSLTFGANDTRLAATYRDGQVRVWNTATRQAVLAPPRCDLQVTCAAFSPDGQHLAWTRGRDVVIENLRPPTSSPGQALLGHEDRSIWSVAFSPDGRYLASRSTTEVLLWDRATAKLVRRMERGTEVASEVPLIFSPDGKLLLSGGKGEQLQAWTVATGKQAPFPVRAQDTRVLAFSSRGGLLATSDGSSSVVVWDVEHNQRWTFNAGVGEVRGLAFTPDGKRLAVGGSLGWVKLWDVQGRKSVMLRGLTDSVWCLAISPDGRRLATGGVSGTVRLWDVSTGQEGFTVLGHNGNVAGIAFSPDNQRIASCGIDGLIKLWDPQTGQEVLTLNGHNSYVTGVCFSPGAGHLLASCGQDGTVRLWDGRPSP